MLIKWSIVVQSSYAGSYGIDQQYFRAVLSIQPKQPTDSKYNKRRSNIQKPEENALDVLVYFLSNMFLNEVVSYSIIPLCANGTNV